MPEGKLLIEYLDMSWRHILIGALGLSCFALLSVGSCLVVGCSGDGISDDGAYETNVYEGTAQIYVWIGTNAESAVRQTERLTIRVYDYITGYRIIELNNSTPVGDIGTTISMDDSVFAMEAQTIWSTDGGSLKRLNRRYEGSVTAAEVVGVVTGFNSFAGASGGMSQTGTFEAAWSGYE